MDFKKRSYQPELLDRDDIPFEDIRRNMAELDFINTYLGGHSITIAGFLQLVSLVNTVNDHTWLICEIGCGGGDNIAAIERWCKAKHIKTSFIGIDINPFCIEVAGQRLAGTNVQLIASDYKLTSFQTRRPDIIFSSLFCHHFSNDQLVSMLQWMSANAGKGFFINDLHRHPLAFYSIKVLTKLFSRSYLVKNDAPLSVLRGFKRKEWEELIRSAGIRDYFLAWKWAFRYLLIVKTEAVSYR